MEIEEAISLSDGTVENSSRARMIHTQKLLHHRGGATNLGAHNLAVAGFCQFAMQDLLDRHCMVDMSRL